jgi:methionyl aminopeptidase
MLDNSYFCSDKCYHGFWNTHKTLHKKFKLSLNQPDNYLPEEFQNYSFSGTLRPWKQSPRILVHDKNIIKPDYALSGIAQYEEEFNEEKQYCVVETEQGINDLRECAYIARKALDLAHSMVGVGVTTEKINDAVHLFIINHGAYPSPLNYYGFPKSICTSVNEVICHGIPDKRPLENGDIVNIDVTVYFKGLHTDLSETYIVGQTDPESAKLLACTFEALQEAIKICKPGVLYRHIGKRIGEIVNKYDFSIVKTYCGHGVGEVFHSLPNVSHYPQNKNSGIMKEGHVFTIEPMINAGVWKDVLWPDHWTATTQDGKRSAQFEHTLLVTYDGVEVLTKRLNSSPRLKFFDYNMFIK